GRGFGRGRRVGFGRGFGRGLRFWLAPETKAEVKEDLNLYRKDLEEELEKVKADQLKLEEEK
ncbi:MAG: hypothetical protein ACD_24C00536G0004, partial [uncultured bacterium]